MRTLLAFISTLVCLTGTLSAEIPRLPLDDIERMVSSYTVVVRGQRDAASVELNYTTNQGLSFRAVLQAELAQVQLNPPKGFESDSYRIYVYASSELANRGLDVSGSIVTLESTVSFGLVNSEQGWRIPDIKFEWTAKPAGQFHFLLPTVTDWDVSIWQNGQKRTFSTKVDLKEFSPDERGCEFLSIRNFLRQNHLVAIPQGVVLPDVPWERLELTLWEGTVSTVQTFEAPKPEVEPLRLAITVNEDGEREIQVSGDGAKSADIEETSDLVHWGPAYSLSSPPTLTSTGVRRQTVVVSSGGGVRFYRARAGSGLQKQ